MAQFDIVRLTGGELAIDCQSDLLEGINTRFVVPLRRPADAPPRRDRLNPVFQIDAEDWVMVTQFAGAIARSDIEGRTGSVASEYLMVTAALDMLISGF